MMGLLSRIFKKEDYSDVDSNWMNKKVYFLGDSITSGTKKSNFVKVTKQILKLKNARNYGTGGGSLVYRDELHPTLNIDKNYPPLISRWQDIDNGADLIFILIGTNDYSSQVPLGQSISTNDKEFNGALNIIFYGLKEKYSDSKIIVSTLLKRVPKPVETHPITIDYYNSAIIDRCNDHNINCLHLHDFNELDLETDFLQGTKSFTNDGLHPNKKGTEILGRHVAEFINNH